MALDFSKFGTPVEQSSALDFAKFGTPVQPPPEKQSAFRQIADVPLGIAKGAVQGVRMIADAFGAGSDTSNTIKSAETYLADLMSAQAKNDQQEISRIMKDAEDKGVLDQVKAGIKAFTVAPVDTLSSALGTAAPVIAGALGAKILGAGALVSTGVSALTGAGMGAGVVKGSIYEETKRTLKEAGASEQDAESRAKLAQEYGGKNLDQILLGTVLGGAAAVGPLEKGAAGILARRILGKTEGTEAVAGQAAKGALRRRAEAGLLEAVPEAVQAGQEQVAQNIALQREGFDVPTFRGAVSSATLEAIAGGGLGATLGGGKPEAPAPVAPPVAPPPAPPVAPPVEPPAPPVAPPTTTATPPAPPAPPAPFTAPGGFVSSLTLSPAYEGIEPLSVEDADFELEALQNSAEKGRLTPEQFAGSEIGKRLDTAQIGFINEGLRADPVGTITALRNRLKEAASAPAAPPVEPAPVVEAAAPAEKPTFEPKIVSRQPAPDGMEVHVFTTTDGYGTGLFDADAQQYVNGSVTRFTGADTLPKAQERAAEMFQKATPPAERPAGETVVPVLSDFQKRLKDYWDNTATPAIRNYLSAINSFGIDRLEKSQIKPTGMSVREWIESFVSKQSTWDKGRKTGETGIQALSTKNLWPTTDGSGERLRKAMLDAVKALKNAPGSTSELVDQAFGESKSTTTAAPKAEAPAVEAPAAEAPAQPTNYRRRTAAENVRKATVKRTNANSAMVWQIIGPDGEAMSGPPGVYPGREGPLAGSATMGNRGWKTKREADAALAYLNQKADEVLGSASSAAQVLPAAEAPVAPEIAPLQDAYNKAKAALDAIGTEPAKLSPEARYFGIKGREGAAPELVRAYDEKVKAYNSWKRKYSKLKKEEVEASNILFRAKQAQERKSLGSAKAQQSNFEQALRTLLNKFGLKDVGLSIIEGMQDAGSYAQQLIRIADRADNPIRTLRHEAIHALRELGFFTDAQWKSLSKMAKDKWIDQYLKQRNVDGKPLKAGEESRYDAYMREYNGDMEKITEEAVADAFADFDASKPPAGLLQALLKRMKDLFQSIKSALTKVESVDQIFGKVEEGKLKPGEKAESGERKSVRDRATANFLRWFGDSKVVDEKGEPLVVYHGTRGDFTEFKPSRVGAMGPGIYFTTKPDVASGYSDVTTRKGQERGGAQVIPVYLSVKNPLVIDSVNDSSKQLFNRIDPTGKLSDDEVIAKLIDQGYDAVYAKEDGEYVVFNPTQIKSAIGNNGDYSLTNADIRKSIGGVSPGQKALETIRSMGMDVKPPEKGFFKRTWDAINGAGENPSLSKEELKKTLTKFTDKIETSVFSTDAAFNNDLTRSVIKDINQQPEVLAMLLQASQSQTVNIDNVTSRALMIGSARHNKDMQKWEAIGTDEDGKKLTNFKDLGSKLEEIAKKYNISVEEAEQIGHTYLIAKRLPGIIRRNAELDAKITAEKATAKPDRKQIEEWDALKVHVSPTQEAMIEPGLSLVKTMPELSEIVDIQQGIRKNIVRPAVESGLWSQEYADAMLDNVDWVPFYRDEQLDAGGGPLQVIRGLQVKSKEFRLKGSDAAVANVFDNQFLWAQYLLSRAMRAQKARAMVDLAAKTKINGEPMAVKVTEEKRGMNIVRVFRDGKQELWDMKDPIYVDAFVGIQNVASSMFPWAAKLAEILRNSVILYPLFSVAQVPQDAFAAIFTSGLKPQYALRIPFLAVKEFIKTLSKTSATHKALINFGVVGARTFNADAMRNDAEIYAGVRPPKGGWAKFKDNLEHISMAGDNAVRQAVYEAAQQQGVSKPEAIEKAFEIFNVRRRGTNKLINLAGSTIPFFYAYLAAQRVAYRTITGAGTSPTQRLAALETLAYTSASVFALSMLYAMMVADDEDYQEMPTAVRDRTLTIPGTGGVRIPLRPDFFLFPKIVAEHTYLMITDQGYQDGAKFRKAMLEGLANAVSSPTPLPQIVKPSLEVLINYSFFDSKPIVGTFEKQKETARQFNDSTSEFAKLIGSTGVMSPLNIDYLVRGYFGSFGGLGLFMTNFLNSDPDVPRPELSWKEVAAALPGTSGFLKRPQESALKNDFYTLRDEVEKAVNTFNDIKTRSPQGMEDFLADEKKMARYMLGKPVDQISQRLSKIRRQMTIITNMPENQMSAEDKSDNIRQLREFEREYLKSVDVKALREMAKI
jgi:hypothetical protein